MMVVSDDCVPFLRLRKGHWARAIWKGDTFGKRHRLSFALKANKNQRNQYYDPANHCQGQ